MMTLEQRLRASRFCAWCDAPATDRDPCTAPGRRQHYFMTSIPRGRPRKIAPDEQTSREPRFVRTETTVVTVPIPAACQKCKGRMVWENEDAARCLMCGKIVFSGPVKPEMHVEMA